MIENVKYDTIFIMFTDIIILQILRYGCLRHNVYLSENVIYTLIFMVIIDYHRLTNISSIKIVN